MVRRIFLQRFFVLSLVFSCFLFSLVPQVALAIGISPGYFEARNLVTGSKIKRTVYVTRANPSRTEFVAVTADGPDAKYITLPQEVLELPKGKQQTPYVFYITPKNAPNGEHNAVIRFTQTAAPNATGGSNGLSTIISINTKVKFFVTDEEVRDFTISGLKVSDTEVNQPIVFSYQLENLGNVDVRPEKVVAKFVNVADPSIIIEGEGPGDKIPAVAPTENQVVVAEVPVEKTVAGTYRGSLAVFDKGVVIAEIKDASFTVHPEGTLQQKIEFTDLLVNREEGAPDTQFRFDAKIKNTGSGNAPVLFNVDIFKDGKNIETLRSERQYVLAGGSGQVAVTFVPKESGKYTARGWLEFGPQRSEEKSIEFKVSNGTGTIIGFIVIVVALLLLCAAGVWFFMKTRHHAVKQKK